MPHRSSFSPFCSFIEAGAIGLTTPATARAASATPPRPAPSSRGASSAASSPKASAPGAPPAPWGATATSTPSPATRGVVNSPSAAAGAGASWPTAAVGASSITVAAMAAVLRMPRRGVMRAVLSCFVGLSKVWCIRGPRFGAGAAAWLLRRAAAHPRGWFARDRHRHVRDIRRRRRLGRGGRGGRRGSRARFTRRGLLTGRSLRAGRSTRRRRRGLRRADRSFGARRVAVDDQVAPVEQPAQPGKVVDVHLEGPGQGDLVVAGCRRASRRASRGRSRSAARPRPSHRWPPRPHRW